MEDLEEPVIPSLVGKKTDSSDIGSFHRVFCVELVAAEPVAAPVTAPAPAAAPVMTEGRQNARDMLTIRSGRTSNYRVSAYFT